MPTTVYLSIRGEGASRVLEVFRRALGEEAASLVVVPTNDDNGYHGSAEVSDVAAAREAFAVARKPFPALKGFIGAGGRERDDAPGRPAGSAPEQARGPRPAEQKGRGGERPQEPRRRAAAPKPPGQEKAGEKPPPPEAPEGGERAKRRSPLRHRNRNQRRQGPDEAPPAP